MKHLLIALALVLPLASTARAVDVNPPLHVEWKVTPAHAIEGRVYNDFITPITRIRLLVQSFDAGDRLVGSQYGYVFGDLTPHDSRYFEVRHVPAADHYRVVVESYVQEQFPSGHNAPH
jgi:hypothetical protein